MEVFSSINFVQFSRDHSRAQLNRGTWLCVRKAEEEQKGCQFSEEILSPEHSELSLETHHPLLWSHHLWIPGWVRKQLKLSHI